MKKQLTSTRGFYNRHTHEIYFSYSELFCMKRLSCLEGCVNKVFERITDDTSSSAGAQSFLRFIIKDYQNGQKIGKVLTISYVLVVKGHFHGYLNIVFNIFNKCWINDQSSLLYISSSWGLKYFTWILNCLNNNKMKTNNDKQGVAGWTNTCDQNKKEKNWTRQLLPHENPAVAKKACLSCEQGRVEVDIFHLEISLEKSYFLILSCKVWVEMSFSFVNSL